MKLALLTALLTSACAVTAQEHNPVHWSAPAVGDKAQPGGRIRVRVAAEIQPGWHLYSLKKIEDGPIPTTITLSPDQPFRLAGAIDAPPPIVMRDPTFDMDVEYYEESAEFVLPVEVGADAKPGPAKVSVAARYQSCNDKMCLPPRTVKIEAAATVATP